jgi:hypothetical protein
MEIFLTYAIPNMVLFGGIYIFSKFVEFAYQEYIDKMSK